MIPVQVYTKSWRVGNTKVPSIYTGWPTDCILLWKEVDHIRLDLYARHPSDLDGAILAIEARYPEQVSIIRTSFEHCVVYGKQQPGNRVIGLAPLQKMVILDMLRGYVIGVQTAQGYGIAYA